MLIHASPRFSAVEPPTSYLDRQAAIAAQATGPRGYPVWIDYTASENAIWAATQADLAPLWDQHAAPRLVQARDELGLPIDHIPQLSLVSERLGALTGFRYASVAGTVPGADFFGALADRTFSSTQFIRWEGSHGYTPEPDVLHEVGGHAVSLAVPELAELHQLAGRASVAAPDQLTAIASVFWYSVEFGVLRQQSGVKAYGAGLLSSAGELASFAARAEIRPLDVDEMIRTPYDIDSYQPVLFGAQSIEHVLDVVGDFYLRIIRTNS